MFDFAEIPLYPRQQIAGGAALENFAGKGATRAQCVDGHVQRDLDQGEGILIGREGVYKLRVPEVLLKNDGEGLDFPRFRMPVAQGLDLASKYSTFSASESKD